MNGKSKERPLIWWIACAVVARAGNFVPIGDLAVNAADRRCAPGGRSRIMYIDLILPPFAGGSAVPTEAVPETKQCRKVFNVCALDLLPDNRRVMPGGQALAWRDQSPSRPTFTAGLRTGGSSHARYQMYLALLDTKAFLPDPLRSAQREGRRGAMSASAGRTGVGDAYQSSREKLGEI